MQVKPYIVKRDGIDAARPFRVLAQFRSFNRCVGSYATKEQAQRRAADWNAKSAISSEQVARFLQHGA